MDRDLAPWNPGSFTKNFSWGPRENGLKVLHEVIRIGFDNQIEDVPRSIFRKRVSKVGRPDFIPINFFLFNKRKDGVDHIIVDELVFQALTGEHSDRFDKLALFAFLFSYVGRWTGAKTYQRWPALWATHYVADRIAAFQWSSRHINADDIERFVLSTGKYVGATSRKLATNLNYLLSIGKISEFNTQLVESWWVDALFLALDRLIEDKLIDGELVSEGSFHRLLTNSDFFSISGPRNISKELAATHLVRLYSICGGRNRFNDELIREKVLSLEDVVWIAANDHRPVGALHSTFPRAPKSIPRSCALLAKYVGFDIIDADDFVNFDPDVFVRKWTQEALKKLDENNLKPLMSAEQIERITRDK